MSITAHPVFNHMPSNGGSLCLGRNGSWKSAGDTGAAKARGSAASFVYPVEGGFTYAHVIGGMGVSAADDTPFTNVGIAALAADLDFPTCAKRVLRGDQVMLAAK